MALIICPECGNECSIEAVICPSCGHPFASVMPRNVTVVQREKEFPKWVILPVAILGVVLLFLVFIMFQKNDDTANTNVNLQMAKQTQRKSAETADRPETHEVVVPSTQNSREVVVSEPAPVQSAPTEPRIENKQTVPAPDKAVVKVSAKVFTKNGTPRPVTREKFYLLDKDLSSILSEANIEDEEGQGLKNAFALSVVNPNKYRETNQKALAAIKKHIVYSTLTDNQGNAEIKSVKPDNYYLFAISATSNSYAIWDAPITVQTGENELTLEPQTLTEVTYQDTQSSFYNE